MALRQQPIEFLHARASARAFWVRKHEESGVGGVKGNARACRPTKRRLAHVASSLLVARHGDETRSPQTEPSEQE